MSSSRSNRSYTVRHLGVQDYREVWLDMQSFTNDRASDTVDELWVVEHPPVYTLGQAGKLEHILNAGEIPIVQTDRGGQVTFHGPGQIIIYTLVDIRRRQIGVRAFVELLENAVMECLAEFNISAQSRRDAPGVYVDGAKIAALGLRVRRGCTFHGLSMNVDMDLTPFKGINPCGYADLPVTSTQDCGVSASKSDIVDRLLQAIHIQLASS
ncbi:MAG: lipoyl(octanoyl) transferase LipB [Gammaproteobacteria bacterium]|nr:lipoyl(octanoyl) transferase LipB [Gammaproteobacteria bacterium]